MLGFGYSNNLTFINPSLIIHINIVKSATFQHLPYVVPNIYKEPALPVSSKTCKKKIAFGIEVVREITSIAAVVGK